MPPSIETATGLTFATLLLGLSALFAVLAMFAAILVATFLHAIHERPDQGGEADDGEDFTFHRSKE